MADYMERNEAPMAEMPLGQDVHESLNQISQIDQEIAHLRKRRVQIQEKIDRGMNEVQRHYSDVINGPTEEAVSYRG